MFKNLLVMLMFGVAFIPWQFVPKDSFVNVLFPELNISCVYGNCILKTTNSIQGSEKCIVTDTNNARVVVERVYFSCREFIGKTVIWQSNGEKLIGTITRSEKTY